jgi:hypothetical protein
MKPKINHLLVFSTFLISCLAPCIAVSQNSYVNNLLNMVSDRSYIQLMRGNVPVRNQNNTTTPMRSTFMEAQISPAYFIRFGDSSKIAINISPKLILRMGSGASFPIKTPSFMPTITVFHRLNATALSTRKLTKWLIKPTHRMFLLYRMAHHSNGQKDEFFVPGTKRINFGTGNFSTDYLELGVQWSDMSGGTNGFSINGRYSIEQHVNITREEDLKELYYNRRLLFEHEFNFSPYLQLGTRFDVMLGNGSRFERRSSFQASFDWQPFKKNSDLSFFVRYYYGPDYYNIRYFSDQQFWGLGIRANPNSRNAFSLM